VGGRLARLSQRTRAGADDDRAEVVNWLVFFPLNLNGSFMDWILPTQIYLAPVAANDKPSIVANHDPYTEMAKPAPRLPIRVMMLAGRSKPDFPQSPQ
jgi:hypothetical protein